MSENKEIDNEINKYKISINNINKIIRDKIEEELYNREKEEFLKRISQFNNKKILNYECFNNNLITTLGKDNIIIETKTNNSYYIFKNMDIFYDIGNICFLSSNSLTEYINELDLISIRYPRVSFVVLMNLEEDYKDKNPEIILLEKFQKKYKGISFNFKHELNNKHFKKNVYIPSKTDFDLIKALDVLEKNSLIKLLNY